ncbi:hypothetical protein D3C71_2107620 [compost metagenome]
MRESPLTHGASRSKHAGEFQADARLMVAVRSPAPTSSEPPVRLTIRLIFGFEIVLLAAVASAA